MIVIAEGGSTKCDWVILGKSNMQIEFQTIGFNPLFHSKKAIINTLREIKEIEKHGLDVEEVFFYGAGSSSPELKAFLIDVLKKIFPNAKNVQSNTDLEAAAYATYSGQPSICCILGTGSNSCLYDGHQVEVSNPALGFILGDEASGAFFGKFFLADYLYRQMPESLAVKFEKKYGLGKKDIVEKVYRAPHPNVFLASFMPFFYENRLEYYIQKILKRGFRKFLLIHVMCFENYKNYPVHFVGSIAHFFNQELIAESEKLGIKTGKIVQRPIQGLIEYHKNRFI